MKSRKRCVEPYLFYDHTGIKARLEEMAGKGWMIERIANFGWVYRRMEPERLTFAVSYCPKSSEFDPEASKSQQMLYEFCAHTGWQLVCTAAQMQIFCSRRENPIPIETDPLPAVHTIHEAAKKGFLPLYFILAALAVVQAVFLVLRLCADPVGLLSSTSGLFSGFAWALVLVLCAADIAGYFFWHFRALKAAERGEFLEVSGHPRFHKGIYYVMLLGAGCWFLTILFAGDNMMCFIAVGMLAGYLALLFLVGGIKRFLKRKKVSGSMNRAVSIISISMFSFLLIGVIVSVTLSGASRGLFQGRDDFSGFPFLAEDLTGETLEGYSREYRISESPLLGQMDLWQYSRTEGGNGESSGLSYTCIEVKLPFLYSVCRNQLLHEYDDRYLRGYSRSYERQDPVPWNAREAYRLTAEDTGALNWYLLCYEDRIIEIQFDWEPTPEQMEIVGEKLA